MPFTLKYSTENPTLLPASTHSYSKKNEAKQAGGYNPRQKLAASIWNLNTAQVER